MATVEGFDEVYAFQRQYRLTNLIGQWNGP